MRVVLASDKFKGSLSAAEVSIALERGMRMRLPDVEVTRVPVADGGDGTVDAFVEGGFTRIPVVAAGPTGTAGLTAYARRGRVGVVELADVSGLARLRAGPEPLAANTVGTGEVIGAALDAGCEEIVLGVGGSASTDGGVGMLVALGARVLDADGAPVTPDAMGLLDARTVDLEPVRRRLRSARVVLAADVDNPLLGPTGAAAVYGPQKGAGPDDVRLLERALEHWADLVADATGTDLRACPGGGAAGGTGFAAIAALGARRRAGIDVVLDLVGFDETVADADLVVTGEGSLDAQSLHGKAVLGVARRARAAGVGVVAVCGRSSLDHSTARAAGIEHVHALTDLEPDVARCIAHAEALLTEVGARLVS